MLVVLAVLALTTNAFLHRTGGADRGRGNGAPGRTGPFNPWPPKSGGLLIA